MEMSEFLFLVSVWKQKHTLNINKKIMGNMSQEGYDKLVAELHEL